MKTKLILALSALVLLLSGFMLYGSLNHEMSEAEIKAQFTDLKSDYEYMQKDLEAAIADASFRTEEIVSQKKRIEVLMSKNTVTEEELQEAKKIMSALSKSFLQNYKQKVIVLEGERLKLTDEKDKIVIEVSSLKEQIAELNQEKKKAKFVLEKKDELLSYASKLNLSNFMLKGFKVRSNGKEIETDKASKIDRIKVFFDVNENLLADSGPKTIYLVVKKPSGETVTFSSRPADFFVFEKKKIQASDKYRFDYNKDQLRTLEFVWDSEDFGRGNYVLEVYEEKKQGIVLIGKVTKSLN